MAVTFLKPAVPHIVPYINHSLTPGHSNTVTYVPPTSTSRNPNYTCTLLTTPLHILHNIHARVCVINSYFTAFIHI